MSPARRRAILLMAGAGRLMPPAKAGWARAMAAETACLPCDREALLFAAGCVRAAAAERLRSLAPDPAWGAPGFAAGALLAVHVSIDGSGTWPLLWPLVAGMLAVRTGGGRLVGLGPAVRLALKTGALAGLLLLAVAVAVTIAEGRPLDLAAPMLVRVAIGAIAGAALAAIGGLSVAPLVVRPHRANEQEDRR